MSARIDSLIAILGQDPNNSRIRHMLANEYANAGAYDDAIATYGALVGDDPDYVPGYFQAGRLAEQEGRLEDARAWLERGMEAAARTGDHHALSEIQAALDLL
jgi:tetratricopeptide (TPR) repeat protein